MGSSQSSYADQQHQSSSSSKMLSGKSVGGRKALFVGGGSNKKKGGASAASSTLGEEAPHGLVGSFVSEPTTAFFVEDPSSASLMSLEEPKSNNVVAPSLGAHVPVILEEVEEEEDAVTVTTDENESEYDSEDEDEAWEERLRVLEDAKQLKALATFFLRPDVPVGSDGVARASCVFDRQVISEPIPDHGDAEEAELIVADARALKTFAKAFHHPEEPTVTSDAAALGRCYFTRPSAPEPVSAEEAHEESRVLEDCKDLKLSAVSYLHPEVPVTSSVAVTRSYGFEPQEDDEEEERALILDDMKLLKEHANMYHHPEAPAAVTDAFATGRNYFGRASASPYEEEEVDAERDDILSDLAALKKAAAMYLHPEAAVEVDATACGRNYYSRPSAETYEEDEVDLERDYAMEDMKALKSSAVQYLHPEIPVESSVACARNFFSRPSAESYEEDEVDLERDHVLEDVKALKASAGLFLHPEVPVVSAVAVTRAAGYEGESGGDCDERAMILEEMQQLKALAGQFYHPESPVKVVPEATARCFFSRPSAEPFETEEEAEAHSQALEDAKHLKTLVTQYRNPQAPLAVEPAVFGRNFFGRASADQAEEFNAEDVGERERVLAEAKALKKLAVDFMHPETAVVGQVAGGRNYFDRPSAMGHDQMIHTFPAHEDDMHHDDHHDEHIDHFGLDEEMEARFEDLRQQLPKSLKPKANRTGLNGSASGSAGSDEEEGKLSRSPSSVMLFTDEPIYD